jgi:DNA-binding HxlR family transcriptional regulator
MTQSVKNHMTCTETMKLLGDYWVLRIIDSLSNCQERFCGLQRKLDNVNPVTLTKRLKTLEEAGLVTRSEETIDKISVCYALTDLGRETLPVIRALDRFSEIAATNPVL